ncbi:MAG: cation:proton antiporter, partial [Lentisphaeraceae bacterium]|nr:cation:proton antiporter [Lentisphaeraceae bacterium]
MEQHGILLILGIGIFGGILGATLFQKLRIPQVVGYIIIGLIIGQSGLQIISSANSDEFAGINQFALGIIGFLVGGELHMDIFKKYGKQFAAILLGEGVLAFLLVGITVTCFMRYIIGDWAQ